jgi:predicted anti-sigma-YlaC factor YlaD
MTAHVSTDELVDAAEGGEVPAVLPPDRAAHLAACAECRAAVREIAETLASVRAVEADVDLSPFEMRRLSDRVRAAADADATRQRRARWAGGGALAALAAAAALVILIRVPRADVRTSTTTPAASAAAAAAPAGLEAAPANDAAWHLVSDMTASLSEDDVRGVVASVPNGPMIETLTPEERQAFVRLVSTEMGEWQ